MAQWFDIPGGAVLSLQRHARSGEREQWAVIPDGDGNRIQGNGGLTILEANFAAGDWEQIPSRPFASIADVLTAFPPLRTLHKGAVYRYDLGEWAGIDERDLATQLDLCPQEGSDDPEDWSKAELEACEWEDLAVWKQAAELPFVRRLASIGELDVSAIDGDATCVPVLADEDGLVALESLARTATDAHPGRSMVGWSGGCELVLLAPGVACNVPWGDEVDSGGSGFFLVSFPEQGASEKVAAALADWITTVSFGFWAALVLEPLDPHGTLTDEQRQAWEDFEDGMLTVSPRLDVPEGIEPLLRAELSRRSESYRRTAEARAEPNGHVAQVLLASDQPDLHYDNWVHTL
jgi:hypothetical protein